MFCPDMNTEHPELVLNAEYTNLPITALRITCRKKLASFLDLDGTLIVLANERDIVNNYNGLAELAGLDYQSMLLLEVCGNTNL